MALFENARARIDPAKANVLLGEIDTIRGLPGAREKYKETGAWKVRSSSIGRPDFDYERTVPEMRNIERQRLRVVERWMGRHGLMRLWMQYVYVRPVSQLDEDAAVMQSGNVVRVYEEPSTTQTVLHRVALGLVRGGEVYGTWEKRQDTYHPLPTDFEHESLTGVDSEESPRSLDPVLAFDYEHAAFGDEAADLLMEELKTFRQGETRLVKMRRALTGKI